MVAKGKLSRVLVAGWLCELLRTATPRRSSHIWWVRNGHLNGELSTAWCIVMTGLTGKLPHCCVSSGATCRAAEPWGARHDALSSSTLGKHKKPEHGASTIKLWFIRSAIFRGISLPSSHHSILKPRCCHCIYLCTMPVAITIPDLWKERWDAERHRACFICLSYTWNKAQS